MPDTKVASSRATCCGKPASRLEAADRQTPPARVQDYRPHLDCGAQLRLARSQSAIKQGLRVQSADLRDPHRHRCNTPYAQPPRSNMRLFKHPLSKTFNEWSVTVP